MPNKTIEIDNRVILFDYTNTTPKGIGVVIGLSEHFVEVKVSKKSIFPWIEYEVVDYWPKSNVEALLPTNK